MAVVPLTPDRRRELTRNVLMDAAAEVFARRGFYGASLEEIAETAGFSRGAIYSNYGSKEDLLLAVAERYHRMILGVFATALESDRHLPGTQRAAAAGALWKDMVRRDANFLALHLEFRLHALRNEEFRRRFAEVQRQQTAEIARLIEREAETQSMRLRLSSEDFAEIFNATSIGLLESAGVDRENAKRYDDLAQRFFVLMAESIVDAGKPPDVSRHHS